MHAAPTLDTIPNEMINEIAHATDFTDYPALRLVCKNINAAVTPHFFPHIFKHLYVNMSRDSFQRLVDICTHPVLGHIVQSITLSPRRLLVEAAVDFHHDPECTVCPGTPTGKIRAVRRYLAACNQQRSFESSGEALRLLTLAIAHIEQLGHSLGLGVHDHANQQSKSRYECEGRHRDQFGSYEPDRALLPLCSKKLYHDLFAHDTFSLYEKRRARTILLLLNAAIQSQHPLRSFSIDLVQGTTSQLYVDAPTEDQFGHIRTTAFEKPPIRQSFANINEFRFHYDCGSADLRPSIAFAIHDMLSFCKHVEWVWLDMKVELEEPKTWWDSKWNVKYGQGGALADFAVKLHSDSLQKLTMNNCLGRKQDLIKILRRHRRTLRTVQFVGCALQKKEDWREVFEFIIENLDLETIHIIHLASYSVHPTHLRCRKLRIRHRCLHTGGATAVKVGLQKLVNRLKAGEMT